VTAINGALSLADIIGVAGVDPSDVVIIRHTYGAEELQSPEDLSPAAVLAYTRRQGAQPGHKLGKVPAPIWLIFVADGQRRARFFCAYDNRGEVAEERTPDRRFFDLHDSGLLDALRGRLVIEWSKDTINWAKPGQSAALFPVVEIADPNLVAFPGYDRVLLPYAALRAVVEDSRYSAWRAALGSVHGIYLITDTSGPGRFYVGKADGQGGILGRWSAYVRDGHGGNTALRDLAALNPDHASNFMFSILRVFSPSTITSEVDEAEAHYKRALLTREYGLNDN
jgi:hypothetical protein